MKKNYFLEMTRHARGVKGKGQKGRRVETHKSETGSTTPPTKRMIGKNFGLGGEGWLLVAQNG